MVSLLSRSTCLVIVLVSVSAHAQPFRVDTLARAPQIQFPTAIAFVPGGDGAFFFSERMTGGVRFYDGTLRPEPFVTVPVDDEGGQGLLGVAVHPSYPDSPFVYVYYVRNPDRAGILERYRDDNGVGVSPQQLLFIPRRDYATGNNGGRMAFGPDGKLYVAVGDHGMKSSNAQDTLGGRNLRGKILRMNPDGAIPADNILPRRPFWSIGHRDPQGIAFDPATGVLYATEGGRESMNGIIAVPRGANLGWPGRRATALEGGGEPKVLLMVGKKEQPAFTGIAVYRGDAFPRLRGNILFTGNADPTLWAGRFDADGDSLITGVLYHSNTGFADVQVGPNGMIYIAVGPYVGSRILRLSPVAPRFTAEDHDSATQGSQYHYTPSFSGTPPEVELLEGPSGMTIDSATWTLRWVPTNAQALEGKRTVIIRARNGAGWADQEFTIPVKNVNDPPSPFGLLTPPDGSEFRFLGENAAVSFAWRAASDPDGDTLRYMLQLDTVATFDSPGRINVHAGMADSVRVMLTSASRSYLWRVIASDGALTSLSTPQVSHLSIVVSKYLGREKAPRVESVLEQNFPNPFNPSTSIKYTLPRGGHVRLTVFNLLGQEVATLFDGTQGEGTYEVGFAKAALPSGIYFYRLLAPGLAETKRMVVTR